jgi:hypothetical protein
LHFPSIQYLTHTHDECIAEATKWKPDLLIYLADLEGDAGEEPTFPVKWAVPEGKSEAPWGKVVELD